MYKVIRMFTDLQDSNYKYSAGDIFPRKGVNVSDERLSMLSGSENRRGVPLIKRVEEQSELPKTEETVKSVEKQVEEIKPESKPKRGRKKE